MTSRERVEAALSHREPDRTPIFEYVLQPPVADAILGRSYVYGDRLAEYVREKGWEAAVRQSARDMVGLAKALGHDLIYAVPNILPDFGPVKSVAGGKKELFSDDPIKEMARRVEEAEAKPPLPDEAFLIYNLLREEMAASGLDLPLLAPAYVHGVWTDTVLMQTMILAPELARRFYATRTREALSLVEKYRSLDIELIGVGGDFAGTRGPIISPETYRKFIVPEVRRAADRVRVLGGFSVNASDGNLWPVIEDFLLGCGVDGYLEIDFFAGMDLGRLKERFGRRITFFGNLDCGNLLSFGTVEEVKNQTRECLRQGWGDGGHILCAGNAITSSVPLRNYLAIYQAYREFFGLPT